MLSLSEIFWSAQGEGIRIGVPSIFIRLAGCSLRCPYCDSKESWKKEQDYEAEEIVQIIDQLKKVFFYSQVVITGGEPLEQDLADLVNLLNQRDYFISIETSGLLFQDLNVDWWSVSPKDVTGFLIHPLMISKISEIKLIVNEKLNLDVVQRMRSMPAQVPIFLQPQHFDPDKYQKTFKLYESCQKVGIANIRLGYQLHRIFKIR